jgi:GxxExxY protein
MFKNRLRNFSFFSLPFIIPRDCLNLDSRDLLIKTIVMLYKEITEKIIGCAMKVHSKLGNGFQEVIYQRALAIEMERAGLNFVREQNMTIYYDEFRVGRRRVDFFVEEKVMVELKAIIQMNDSNLAQAFYPVK